MPSGLSNRWQGGTLEILSYLIWYINAPVPLYLPQEYDKSRKRPVSVRARAAPSSGEMLFGAVVARRAFVFGALASLRPQVLSAGEPPAADAQELEDQLLAALEPGGVGARRSPSELRAAEGLIAQLERLGGSQKALAEGLGSYEVPWIGCWDVLFLDGAAGFPASLAPAGGATLRGARQFVYGPPNVKDDLRGIDREGGTSIECTYEIPPGPGGAAPPDEARPASHVLLASSGSLTKLPSFAYRLDFTQPARAYALPSAGGAGAADGDDGVVSLPELPAAAADSLIRTAVGGATLKQISYLSERVWISRGGDGSALAVLARCNARALAPPAGRPDLTAPCSDTRGTLCRRRAQF